MRHPVFVTVFTKYTRSKNYCSCELRGNNKTNLHKRRESIIIIIIIYARVAVSRAVQNVRECSLSDLVSVLSTVLDSNREEVGMRWYDPWTGRAVCC